MNQGGIPRVLHAVQDNGGREVVLSGAWTLASLGPTIRALSVELAAHGESSDVTWNCLGIETMDSTGAMLLWGAWGRKLPARLLAYAEQLRIFGLIAGAEQKPGASKAPPTDLQW